MNSKHTYLKTKASHLVNIAWMVRDISVLGYTKAKAATRDGFIERRVLIIQIKIDREIVSILHGLVLKPAVSIIVMFTKVSNECRVIFITQRM